MPKKCARSTPSRGKKVREMATCARTFFTLGKVVFSANEVKSIKKVREIVKSA
jgi:hypothetical protein